VGRASLRILLALFNTLPSVPSTSILIRSAGPASKVSSVIVETRSGVRSSAHKRFW